MLTRTGYTVTGGTRSRLTHWNNNGPHGYTIALWQTGRRYTIEHTVSNRDSGCSNLCVATDANGALLDTEQRARDTFEEHVRIFTTKENKQ